MRKKGFVFFRWIFFFVVLFAVVFYYCGTNLLPLADQGELLIKFIGYAEDADCILLKQNNVTVLIDSGPVSAVENTVQELKNAGVEKIDYFILTHPDLMNSESVLILRENFQITTMIEPNYSVNDVIWKSMNSSMRKAGVQIIIPTNVRTLLLGDMQILILPPNEKRYNNVNNYSLALLVSDDDVKLLFPGAAGKKRLAELRAVSFPKIDLYAAADHGRLSDNSAELITQIRPNYAVVSAIKEDEALSEAFFTVGTEVFSSHENTLTFVSNGKSVELRAQDEE